MKINYSFAHLLSTCLFSLTTLVESSYSQTHIPRAIPVDDDLNLSSQHSNVPKQSKFYMIKKPYWDEHDEQEFSDFVAKIGSSKCKSLSECLKSDANPYRHNDPEDLEVYADCADFPYMLRAYFAWKKGLPFSLVTGLASKDPPSEDGKMIDYRTTKNGNKIAARTGFAAEPILGPGGEIVGGKHYTIEDIWDVVHNRASSSMYRTDPRDESIRLFSDLFPVPLSRDVIKPGTVIYNSNGHVAVVYKVSDNGDVGYLQASTDYAVTRGVFSKSAFPQSRIEHGWGFKNWRPQNLAGATKKRIKNEKGEPVDIFLSGEIHGKSDDQLRKEGKFSLEQYQHQSWKYDYNGQKLDWEDYVSAKLSRSAWRRDPLADFRKRLSAICIQASNRVESVNKAVEQGVHLKPHPEKMPTNIFVADQPEWEAFSTPGRDADLRSMILDLRTFTKNLLSMSKEELSKTSYSGTSLKKDLKNEYMKIGSECKVNYKNSRGKEVALALSEVISRADKLSFDPYHCPELRWGASGKELASCVQFQGSMDWYHAQQGLRQASGRDTQGFYGYDLFEAQKQYSLNQKQIVNFDLASEF